MLLEPRTIAYACELHHLPLALDPLPLQRLHNRLYEAGAPPYPNFALAGEAVLLSKPAGQPQSVSQIHVQRDRFSFREELTELTTEEFAERVVTLSTDVARARGVQIFTSQVVTVRTLVNLRHFRDAREFLRLGMFGFGSELGVLGREAQLFGLRLVFPPTSTHPNTFHLRVESFAGDNRALFLENQANFGPLLSARSLEPVGANIETTYRFLVERVCSFLTHFDLRTEA
ncbi:MAG: hypothetical protein ABL998_22475 [Planctomycetota bacterium]